MLRSTRSRLAVAAVLCLTPALTACLSGLSVEGITLAMDDPSGLLARATAARLLVLPAEGRRCLADGGIEPPVPDDFAESPREASAVLELSTGAPRAETTAIVLAEGDYLVFVQARGDDPLSGRRDAPIGHGCAEATVEGGETAMVRIQLHAVVVEGVCGDGALDADEQCDDGGTADGDGCSATCRTEPVLAGIAVGGESLGIQDQPALAWRPGQRLVLSYRNKPDRESPDVHVRIFSEVGEPLSSPAALAVGFPVDRITGEQRTPSLDVAAGGALVAFHDVRSALTQGGDVRTRHVATGTGEPDPSGSMPSRGVSGFLHDPNEGTQRAPVVSLREDGEALVVFEDSRQPSGLAARRLPAGSGVPAASSTDAWPVGASSAGPGVSPALTRLPNGWLLAFEAAGDVWVQRLDETGRPEGSPSRPLEGADAEGRQGQPALATLQDPSSGEPRILLAWEEEGPRGDDDGSTIRALLLDASGTPLGSPVRVPTTTVGNQTAPAVTARSFERAGMRYARFVVLWQHGRTARARLFDERLNPALYRTAPPSAGDFEVASNAAGGHAIAAGDLPARPGWATAWSDGEDTYLRFFPLP